MKGNTSGIRAVTRFLAHALKTARGHKWSDTVISISLPKMTRIQQYPSLVTSPGLLYASTSSLIELRNGGRIGAKSHRTVDPTL
jgi:hypothetical protein